MKSLERVHGTTGIKIIIGSAFFWAWLDALFMSMFFVRPEAEGFMAEMATIAVFGLSLPWLALSLAKPAACNGLLAKKRVPLAFAALGTAGSLLLLLAGINLNWIALVAGGTCAGAFMAAYQLAWGAAYCHDGERSATPYVAGGFACAIVVDAPLLFMIPEAAAVFSALLPLVSGALFASIDPQLRTYRRTAPVDPLPKRSVRSRLKAHLGTSMMLLCAVALVMTGFGYLQHLVSFSPIASDGYPNGILVQVARGVTAVLVFAIVVLGRRRASAVYRVGLLAMIAGFMLMAFLFGTNLFWVSGAIIISGYTILDLLIWVAFSQIAHAQSRDPLKTIALMRLLAVLCYPVGAVAGIMLVGNGETMHGNVAAETTVWLPRGHRHRAAAQQRGHVDADGAPAAEPFRRRPRHPGRAHRRLVRQHRPHCARARDRPAAGVRPHAALDRRAPQHIGEHCGHPRAPHLPEGGRARSPAIHRFGSFT